MTRRKFSREFKREAVNLMSEMSAPQLSRAATSARDAAIDAESRGDLPAAIDALATAVSALDFTQPALRHQAARWRAQIAWWRNSLPDYTSKASRRGTILLAEKAMHTLEAVPDSRFAFGQAALSAGLAAWSFGAAESARHYARGLAALGDGDDLPLVRRALHADFGLALSELGDYDTAIPELQSALKFASATQPVDHGQRAGIQRRLANAYQEAGHLDLAGELLDASKRTSRKTEPAWIGWLNSSGLLAERQGRHDDAFHHYREAAECVVQMGRSGAAQGAVIGNVALLELDHGFLERAEERLKQLHELASEVSPTNTRLSRHRLEARMASARRNFESAIASWESAVHLLEKEAEGDAARLAEIKVLLSDLYDRSGREIDSIHVLKETVPRDLTNFESHHAIPAARLARRIAPRAREHALALLRCAVPAALARNEPTYRFEVFDALADIYALGGLGDASIWAGKRAVEAVAASVTALPPRDVAAHEHFSSRIAAHDRLIDRLVAAERIREAFAVQRASSREKAAHYTLRTLRAETSQASFAPMNHREKSLTSACENEGEKIRSARARLVDWKRPLTSEQRSKHEEVIATAQKRLAAQLKTLETPGAWALSTPGSAATTRSPPGTSRWPVIAYFPGKTSLTISVSAGAEPQTVTVPIKSSDLAHTIYRLLTGMGAGRHVLPQAQQLYEYLISPIAHFLTAFEGFDIITHGAVDDVPFAALHDGDRFVVEHLAHRRRTLLGNSLRLRTGQTYRRIVTLAVAGGNGEEADLRHAEYEAAGIKEHVPCVAELFRERATLVELHEVMRRGCDMLHLATHFDFHPADPKRSRIALANNRHVAVGEFLAALTNVDDLALVVMALCDSGATAHGYASDASGFVNALHARGAGDVIAGLWPLVDHSTALLVRRFWAHLFASANAKIVPAEALRRAQCDMLAGNHGPDPAGGQTQTATTAARSLGIVSDRSVSPIDAFAAPAHWSGVALFAPGTD